MRPPDRHGHHPLLHPDSHPLCKGKNAPRRVCPLIVRHFIASRHYFPLLHMSWVWCGTSARYTMVLCYLHMPPAPCYAIALHVLGVVWHVSSVDDGFVVELLLRDPLVLECLQQHLHHLRNRSGEVCDGWTRGGGIRGKGVNVWEERTRMGRLSTCVSVCGSLRAARGRIGLGLGWAWVVWGRMGWVGGVKRDAE